MYGLYRRVLRYHVISLTFDGEMRLLKPVVAKNPKEYTSLMTYLLATVATTLEAHFPEIDAKLCPTHRICWCESCVAEYGKNGYTLFRNGCVHEQGRCVAANESQLKINQLEFLLEYAEALESMVELELERVLNLTAAR